MNHRALIVTLATLTVCVGLPVAPLVKAHQDPLGCNAGALQQFPTVIPSSAVYEKSELTYSVTYVNVDPDGVGPVLPCKVTSVNATITLPNGVEVISLSDISLNAGESVRCPEDSRCAAGPYHYRVDQADEVGGYVTASFHIDGVLHRLADQNTTSKDDSLSTFVLHPSARLTKTAATTQLFGSSDLTYTYVEYNTGTVILTNPLVIDEGCEPLSYETGDINNNGLLDPQEAWSYTCSTFVDNTTSGFAIGHGIDPFNNDVTWCEDPQNPPAGVICDQEQRATTKVGVIKPSILVGISSTIADSSQSTMTLTVTEKNDGDVALDNAFVSVSGGVGVLNENAPTLFGDSNSNKVLDGGETWRWLVNVPMTENAVYTVTGHGMVLGYDVTWCEDPQNPPPEVICDQDGLISNL